MASFWNSIISDIFGSKNNHSLEEQKKLGEKIDTGKTIRVSAPKSSRFSYEPGKNLEQLSKHKEDIESGKHTADEQTYQAEINSTALDSYKYDPKTESLWVKFKDGKKKYWYPRVPAEKVKAMLSAPSTGQYFHDKIHNVYSINKNIPEADRPRENMLKNQRIKNYYKKMQKYYKNVRKTGKM